MRDRNDHENAGMGRRHFLLAAGTLAASPLLGGLATQASARSTTEAVGRRRLGALGSAFRT
jgi:hypothetical protein